MDGSDIAVTYRSERDEAEIKQIFRLSRKFGGRTVFEVNRTRRQLDQELIRERPSEADQQIAGDTTHHAVACDRPWTERPFENHYQQHRETGQPKQRLQNRKPVGSK